MKSNITAIFAMFFFLLAGSASAATTQFSIESLQTIQSDMICAEKKKKKESEEEEPECD